MTRRECPFLLLGVEPVLDLERRRRASAERTSSSRAEGSGTYNVGERDHADLIGQAKIHVGSAHETMVSRTREKRMAHRLPDAETDTRGDTAVEALDAVLAVDVRERVGDRRLGGAVRVSGGRLGHRLHLGGFYVKSVGRPNLEIVLYFPSR